MPLVSPPNLDLAQETSVPPPSEITPGYQAPPAPLGLADYGVGSSGPYAYNTTHFLATVDLASPPNVTAPSSEGVIDPAGGHLGAVGSPYEFSLQLNTVATNVTIPGANNSTIWAQNVLDINASAIHFVDDVWNLSAYSHFQFSLNAISSGCGLTNLTTMLELEGGVYQCVGTTLPISAASYPLSIELYNNASVTGIHDQIQFGYHITADGRLLSAGTIDSVVFANPTGVAPAKPIGYEVNGYSRAPVQPSPFPRLLYDSEIVFGGPIGGTNAVFRSLKGDVSLQYTGVTETYQSVTSAFNFGSDTGETAVGISSYWNATGVEQINQGPSFLYGLWGTPASLSVGSGSLHFAGSVSPNYGFVFLSNVNPGPTGTNLSYVPTTATGTFNSWLPPVFGGAGAKYYTEMYAAGFTPENGSNFTTSRTGYSFPAPTANLTIEAPLYMQDAGQATGLLHNVTGVAPPAGPLHFNGLVVNLPRAFTHLNDYLYPSFVIFQAEGIGTPIYVNNTTEGTNAPGGEIYTLDAALPMGGWMTPAPSTTPVWGNYTEEFNFFWSADDRVSNESFTGSYGYVFMGNVTPGIEGGVAFFFHETDGAAWDIESSAGSYGVANILSRGTTVKWIEVSDGAHGLSDIGSTGSTASYIEAAGYFTNPENDRTSFSVAVAVLDGKGESVRDILAISYGYGYVSGYLEPLPAYYRVTGSVDATVQNVTAADGALAVGDAYSSGDRFTNVSVFDASGVAAGWSHGTSVSNLTAWPDVAENILSGFGVLDYASNWTNVSAATFDLQECGHCYGAEVYYGNNTTFSGTTIAQNYSVFGSPERDYFDVYGVYAVSGNYLTVRDTTINQSLQLGYGSEDFYNDLDAEGIVSISVNHTVIETTSVSMLFSVFGTYESGYNEADFLGIGVSFSNHSAISGTTLMANFSASNLYEAFGNGAYFTGVIAEYAGNTTISGTTATESYSLSRMYTGDDNDGGFAAAALLGDTDSSISTTRAVANYSVQQLGYADNNEVEFYGVAALGDLLGTVSGTSMVQNYSVTNIGGEVYDDYIEYWGVWVEESNQTTVTGTTVWESALIWNLPGEVEYEEVYFLGVVGEDLYGFSVSGTSATQNVTTFNVDYVYENYFDFVAVAVDSATGVTVRGTTGSESFYAWYVGEDARNELWFALVVGGEVTSFTVSSTTVMQSYIYGDYDCFYDNWGYYYGVYVENGATVSVTGTAQTTTLWSEAAEAYAVYLEGVTGSTVTTVSDVNTVPANETGAEIIAVYLEDCDQSTVSGVTVSGGAVGVYADPSSDLTISDVTAAGFSVGVELDDVSGASVTDVSATDYSVGAGAVDSYNVAIAGVTASDLSVAAVAVDSNLVTITGITATDTTTSSPWNWVFIDYWDLPVGAVFTGGSSQVTVSDVTATNYPAAVIDYYSGESGPGGLTETQVTANGGWVLAMLNGTENSVFTDFTGTGLAQGLALNYTDNLYFSQVTVTHDTVGAWVYDADDDQFTALNASNDAQGMYLFSGEEGQSEYNQVWSSVFSNDTTNGVWMDGGYANTFWLDTFANDGSYGVYLWDSYCNTIWDNTFIGDNGATTTYSPSHIQAWTSNDANAFNSPDASVNYEGNYWADWHTYTSAGVLAPYYVGAGDWDYHPIGVRAGEYAVEFLESGLASGASWSVTFNGVTQSTTNAALWFGELAGTYAFTVTAPAGYSASPASGTVSVPLGASDVVAIAFTAVYAVSVSESGLPSGTSWGAIIGGVTATSTTPTVTVELPSGSYTYQVLSVAGYSVSPSTGTVTVSGAPYATAVTFTADTYAATITESGLPAGTVWSVIVGGVPGTSASATISIPLTAGTYTYTVLAVPGYTASTTSGSLTVSATPSTLAVAFTPATYTVTVTESGLPAGTSWSAVVGGSTATGAGTSLTLSLPAGTYTFEIVPVSGYSASPSTGTVTVTSGGASIVVSFSAVSVSPAYVKQSTFNPDYAVALAIAAVAAVIALLALFRPRKPAPVPPASQWQEPAQGASGGTGH